MLANRLRDVGAPSEEHDEMQQTLAANVTARSSDDLWILAYGIYDQVEDCR